MSCTTSSPSLGPNPIVFLFSHGAGAGIKTHHCQKWIRLLGEIGLVRPFDYDYMMAPTKRPPPALHNLVEQHVQEFMTTRSIYRDAQIIMAGRSMGSRVACHAAADPRVDAAAIICFSYPLVAGKGKIRDQILRETKTPILFIQGTRDRMCPVSQLKLLCNQLHNLTTIHIFDGGDHSLTVPKRSKRPQEECDQSALSAIREFAQDHIC